ncbi:MAG TPA: peptide-methionine (S)-S-oxide reductase MsrA [Candidatus Dormibacteraeota bacterium]|nr:peptide-methionine (S)-S-oxide reductase MsrA [Candidatus Dormibacteraeota bacterium]
MTQKATLAGGCFWCLEAAYQQVKGVHTVTNGYVGGSVPNPTYEQVCGGSTGHAEAVQIEFNPNMVSFGELLDIFWAIHDPTTRNRQGNDIGSQYRSVIFYHNHEQKASASASIRKAASLWKDPITTELLPLTEFYPAEEYHRDYFARHPEEAYCRVVINPKLQKLKHQFASKLKI